MKAAKLKLWTHSMAAPPMEVKLDGWSKRFSTLDGVHVEVPPDENLALYLWQQARPPELEVAVRPGNNTLRGMQCMALMDFFRSNNVRVGSSIDVIILCHEQEAQDTTDASENVVGSAKSLINDGSDVQNETHGQNCNDSGSTAIPVKDQSSSNDDNLDHVTIPERKAVSLFLPHTVDIMHLGPLGLRIMVTTSGDGGRSPGGDDG